MEIAVFISGAGTNLDAIYAEQQRREKSGTEPCARVACVYTNVPGGAGAKRAREWGLTVVSLSSKGFFDVMGKGPDDDSLRDYYDAAALALVESVSSPDIIVLAGYRRRLGARAMERYANRVINLYPGDTTRDYLVKGVDACVQAIGAGESTLRATVFLNRSDRRFGPALAQSPPVSLAGFGEGDAQEMGEKMRGEAEWKVLPFVVHDLIAGGRVAIDEEEGVWVDGVLSGPGGYQMG